MSREYIQLYCDKIDIGFITFTVIPSLRVIKSHIETSVTFNVQPHFMLLLVAMSHVDQNILELSKSFYAKCTEVVGVRDSSPHGFYRLGLQPEDGLTRVETCSCN
jgi:hypothetical protein